MKKIETEIIEVGIDELQANDYNPKQHKEDVTITESIRENGYVPASILTYKENEKYTIIDGEHRFMSLKKLGIQKVKISVAKNITKQEAKKLTIWLQEQVPFNPKDLAEFYINERGLKLPEINLCLLDEKNYEVEIKNTEKKLTAKANILATPEKVEKIKTLNDLVNDGWGEVIVTITSK